MKTSFNKGFTLIEMMVVVALIGILMAIAIPSLLSQRPMWRVNGASRALLTDMRLTQSMAIRSGDPHAIIFDGALKKYDVISDDGAGGGARGDGIKNGAETIIKTVDISVGYKDILFGSAGATRVGGGVIPADGVDFPTRGGFKSVIFRPDGSAGDGGAYLYPANSTAHPDWQRAVTVVGSTGRVKVFVWTTTTGWQ